MNRFDFLKLSAYSALTSGFAGLSALVQPVQAAQQAIKIGVLIPLSGPAALFGASSRNCAILAAEEINLRSGLAGSPVELVFADAGGSAEQARQVTLKLWKQQSCLAFVGMHDSAVRAALINLFKGEVPYIYTPTYEGGECSKGTYVLGETPTQQLKPVIPWLSRTHGLKRWYLIGNDYNWPRDTNAEAKRYIAAYGGSVVGEDYLPFNVNDFSGSLTKIQRSEADAVLITLVGGASIGFNQAFALLKMDRRTLRLGTLIEENTLAGIGAAHSANLFVSSGYFASLQSQHAKAFAKRYADRFGAQAPTLNVLAQSCYEGLLLLEAMAKRAGSMNASKLEQVAQWLVFEGPRGSTVLHNRHAIRDIYVAKAQGTAFQVIKTFEAQRSGQGCKLVN